MTESFSLYTPRASRLHQLHPLTKLSLAGFLLMSGLAAPEPWGAYVVFVLLLLPLALAGKVLRLMTRAAWRVTWPFAFSVLLVQGLFWPGGTPLIGWGLFSLKREGLIFALTSTGRILVVVSAFTLFALTTRPDHLMTALRQRGLPGSLTYVVIATIQIVPRFQAKASAILDAQRARGLETQGRLLQRLRAVLPLVVPLVLGSLVDVEERALALEARAFSHAGPKTSFTEAHEAAWEPVARLSLVVGILVAVGARLWWGA